MGVLRFSFLSLSQLEGSSFDYPAAPLMYHQWMKYHADSLEFKCIHNLIELTIDLSTV